MKLILTLLVLNLFAVLAVAGNPDQDPVVAALRDKFQNGHIPNQAELQFTKTWNCTDFSAARDKYEQEGPVDGYSFDGFDSVITNSVLLYGIKNYVYSADGLVGVRPPGTHVKGYEYLKVSKDGDIITEYSINPSERPNLILVPALSKPELGVLAYTLCPLAKVH